MFTLLSTSGCVCVTTVGVTKHVSLAHIYIYIYIPVSLDHVMGYGANGRPTPVGLKLKKLPARWRLATYTPGLGAGWIGGSAARRFFCSSAARREPRFLFAATRPGGPKIIKHEHVFSCNPKLVRLFISRATSFPTVRASVGRFNFRPAPGGCHHILKSGHVCCISMCRHK